MRQIKAYEPKTPAEPAINQKQIVQAALSLLNEVGFDGLTMRSLAKKLDIKAASLYWHVRGKQELLDLLAEEICAPMHEPDRHLPWYRQMEALAYEYRRILLIHKDGARVLTNSGAPTGPNRLRLTETALSILLDAGFRHQDAVYAGFLMVDFVTMFVIEETQLTGTDEGNQTQTAPSESESWLEALPQKEYPSIVTLSKALLNPDVEERFRFGIEILINGLKTHLSNHNSNQTAEQ